MTALWTGHGGGSGGSDSFGSGAGYRVSDGYDYGNGGTDGSGASYTGGYGFGSGGSVDGDGYSDGYGFPEQDVETSRVAIGRALIEYPGLAVVELTTLAVTP